MKYIVLAKRYGVMTYLIKIALGIVLSTSLLAVTPPAAQARGYHGFHHYVLRVREWRYSGYWPYHRRHHVHWHRYRR